MISVVIPLYNKEKSITTTLQSVLDQTYTNWECIIINDGSTDNSLEVVKNFVDKFRNSNFKFQILSKPNGGVSSARNRGIMEAKGEYVVFLDADDLWTPDYLETFHRLTVDYPDAGLYCIGYRCIRGTVIPPMSLIRKEGTEMYRGRVESPWTPQLDIFTSSCGSSKKRIMDVGMFDIRMTHGEDIDLYWRLILDGGMVIDEKCCSFYRLDSENRAMHRQIPLEKHIPYYTEKYAALRAANSEFRRFFDEQMIYRLYPYLLDEQYRKEACRVAKEFDYSQLKWSMHFRMLFPRVWQLITRIK